MNRIEWRIKAPETKGGRWVATRTEMTSSGMIRVHGTGETLKEARHNAGEKHSEKLDRIMRRVSRPVSQHPD